MSGKIKNCNGPFVVYHLVSENYIGVTSKIKRRITEHKRNGKYVDDYTILKTFDNLDEALDYEYTLQIKNGSEVTKTRNQKGNNNPIAAQILHTPSGKIYSTIKDAAMDLGLNYGSIRNQKYKEKMKLVNV